MGDICGDRLLVVLAASPRVLTAAEMDPSASTLEGVRDVRWTDAQQGRRAARGWFVMVAGVVVLTVAACGAGWQSGAAGPRPIETGPATAPATDEAPQTAPASLPARQTPRKPTEQAPTMPKPTMPKPTVRTSTVPKSTVPKSTVPTSTVPTSTVPTPTGKRPASSTGSLPIFDVGDHEATGWASPDGSVVCVLFRDGGPPTVRCDVDDPRFAPPAKPADCQGDWGRAITITGDKAALLCAGDSIEEEALVGQDGAWWYRTSGPTVHSAAGTLAALPSATTVTAGDELSCISDTASITCLTCRGQHGFVISAPSYTTF